MRILRNSFRNAFYLVVLSAFGVAIAGSYEDFFSAITRDDRSGVESLLERGFDPNSRDASGQTGLFLALRGESLKAAEALLQRPGLDVNARNTAGESALMMAALRGQTAQVQALLKRGAAVNQPGWTPLHYAATGPQPALVKLLLDQGAAVDADSPNRSTPLMMAARYGAEPSVDLLLARGADAKRRNEQGLSAADFARQGGRAALAARLAPMVN